MKDSIIPDRKREIKMDVKRTKTINRWLPMCYSAKWPDEARNELWKTETEKYSAGRLRRRVGKGGIECRSSNLPM